MIYSFSLSLWFPIIFAILGIILLYLLQRFFCLYTIDTTSKKTGGDAVAAVLKKNNVDYVFTLCGGHISGILVALNSVGIKVYDVRHEATAAFAAEMASRISGNIGVVIVTAGPGVLNTVTATVNATLSESPMLIIGGGVPSFLKGQGSLQDIDQLKVFKGICKYSVVIRRIKDIIPILSKAIKYALEGVPGPVFVEIPINLLYPFQVVFNEAKAKTGKKNIIQRITGWYLERCVCEAFDKAFLNLEPPDINYSIPLISNKDINIISDLCIRAKKPIILIGSQGSMYPVGPYKVSSSLESIGIPVFTSSMSRGLLRQINNKLRIFKQKRREAVKEADLIILAGMICDFRLSYGSILNKNSKIISVNRSYKKASLNKNFMWKAHKIITADPADFLVRLSANLASYNLALSLDSWFSTLKFREVETNSSNFKKSLILPENKKGINPLKLFFCLNQVTSNRKCYYIGDGGDFVATASYIINTNTPHSWLDAGPFGSLGPGAGYALSAKLNDPSSYVILIYGDGAFGFSAIELDTFSRYNLPIIIIIGNNGSWEQIEREQINIFKDDTACKLVQRPYENIAHAFNAESLTIGNLDNNNIESITDAEIIKIIEKGFTFNDEGKSVIINVYIGSTDFRKGSISA